MMPQVLAVVAVSIVGVLALVMLKKHQAKIREFLKKHLAKLREFLRHALTDLFSMTPWPLEAAGAFMLWHYGTLFSSSLVMTHNWRTILDQIMPNDGWGIAARALALVLSITCGVSWLGGIRMYGFRIALAVVGLVVWSVLVYSCWRADVPSAIYRIYVFFLVSQMWVAMLLHARRRTWADESVGAMG